MRLLPLLLGACWNVWVAASVSRSRLKGGHTPWATVRALLGSSQLPPAPAPASLGAPGQTVPMPEWAQQQTVSLNAGAPAAAQPAAPAAAQPAAPGGANPCYACLPPDQRPAKVNKDLQDVAAEKAESQVEDAAHDAAKDTESTIAS